MNYQLLVLETEYLVGITHLARWKRVLASIADLCL